MPPEFPQFSRFPPEIQIMVWKQFIQIEAANRLVLYHEYTGLDEEEAHRRDLAKIPYPLTLRVMPSKWLVSPLLSVDSQARAVALEQYTTRLDIFDLPRAPFTYRATVPCPPYRDYRVTYYVEVAERNAYEEAVKEREAREDTWIRPCEAAEMWQTRAIPRWRWTYPEEPGWVDRRTVCVDVDEYVIWQAHKIMMYEPADVKAYRGCVYLNLATDRFAGTLPWAPASGHWYGSSFERHDGLRGPRRTYGLRALSDALTDFQYHETPFHLREVLDRRRPAPLRFASAGLPDEVLGQIRHLAFAEHELARIPQEPPVLPPCPVFGAWLLGECCPQALTPENDCLWTYDVTEEMFRSFFDDLEDKGAEHLALRKTKMRKIEIEDDLPDLDDQGNPILPIEVYVALAVDE
ncbi:hypothetical protein PG991_003458 [Apiospora marii]|uniref:2EXR domain-containing protein n=1 Tax=Apiospora marii TaxID=335849 RepID=A0ABR1S3H7_9PEZI